MTKFAVLVGSFAASILLIVWLFFAFVKWDFSVTAFEARFFLAVVFIIMVLTVLAHKLWIE